MSDPRIAIIRQHFKDQQRTAPDDTEMATLLEAIDVISETRDNQADMTAYERGLRDGMMGAAAICNNHAAMIEQRAPQSPFILAHRYDAMVISEAAKGPGCD